VQSQVKQARSCLPAGPGPSIGKEHCRARFNPQHRMVARVPVKQAAHGYGGRHEYTRVSHAHPWPRLRPSHPVSSTRRRRDPVHVVFGATIPFEFDGKPYGQGRLVARQAEDSRRGTVTAARRACRRNRRRRDDRRHPCSPMLEPEKNSCFCTCTDAATSRRVTPGRRLHAATSRSTGLHQNGA